MICHPSNLSAAPLLRHPAAFPSALAARRALATWLGVGALIAAGSALAAGPAASAALPPPGNSLDNLQPRLRLSLAPLGLRPPRATPLPAFLFANELIGDSKGVVASGQVELRQLGLRLQSDKLTYLAEDESIAATGNLEFATDLALLRGDSLRYRLHDQTGRIEQPTYQFAAGQRNGRLGNGAHGSASAIVFAGENQYELEDATFSTCRADDDSWFLKVANLELDYDAEVGDGYNAAVWFKGVPIFYSPWITFPLNNKRKTGLLPPTIGSTSVSGFEFTVPYYLNLAPNMDATIAPRVLAKRGSQLNTEFRYLSHTYSGETRVEWLPGDRIRDIDRWAYAWQHRQQLPLGLSAGVNLNGVSDDNYYRDLSSRSSSSAQTQLVRQATLGLGKGAWQVGAQALRYQTLQPDPANLVARPYELLPRVELQGREPLGEDFMGLLNAQYTFFSHPERARVRAHRNVLYPQISLPVLRPWGYFTPKIGLHMTRYAFEGDAAAGLPEVYQREVPIASFDAGLVFERDSEWFGGALLQTLEPRLYYLFVPFRDQSFLSDNRLNFDSGIADFNFAQIFSENLFTGQDRIADANQFTVAATTRFLDPESGGELLNITLGQRFYLSDQRVTLIPEDAPRTERKTDILGAAAGRLSASTWLDGGIQYNPRDTRTERLFGGLRYLPETGRALNLTYRMLREQTAPFDVSVEQLDVSGQWPLFGGWQGVGRYNYSLDENRPIEIIAGLEYRAACWSARAVVQRYATTADESVSAIFLQLELTDFSRIGSNPLELLRRSIPGYGQVDRSVSDPVFGM